MANSHVDRVEEMARKLLAEQLKKNAIDYNVDRYIAFSEDVENLFYENTGLDEVQDRAFTKKERIYRKTCFDVIKNIHMNEGIKNALESFDRKTQKIVKSIGDLNMDKFNEENERLTTQILEILDDLELVDILDVGADLI